MNKAIAEFLVGATVVLGLAGVAVLLLLFGEFAGARQQTYTAYMRLADATGLSSASAVTLNGVQIGSIRSIASSDDPRRGVVLELRVLEGARIPRDAEVTLERGLVGEAALAMRAGPVEAGKPDPGYLAAGETLDAEAGGMLDQIASLMDARLSSFSAAADDLRTLARSFSQAGDRLSEALSPRTPEQVDAGSAPANLVSTVARLDGAISSARDWLGDEELRTDVRGSAARLEALLDEASKAVGAWNDAAGRVTRQAELLGEEGASALQEFSASARSLDAAATEVRAVAEKVNRGEGTAGQLINNPDLYRSLNDAAIRLERALTEAQLLVEKYRKEGIPIRF